MLDALVTRRLKLPPPVAPYTVERSLRIPMRDGVMLAADHYAPGGTPQGTLLVRGPYGRGFPYSLLYARVYAARGYHVLFVSSRGTAASGGTFDPMRTERDDGRDVIAWLTARPWFTGTFGTVGPSYLGYTQWAVLEEPPPEMVTAVVTVGPHDFARHFWGTGAFNLDIVGWSDMVSRLPRTDRPPRLSMLRQIVTGPLLRRGEQRVVTKLPMADAGDRHFAGRAPWFRERATRPDIDDPYYVPIRHAVALDRVQQPVLLLSGWQDLFIGQTIEQYTRLRERGVDVALTVGPWTHVEAVFGPGTAMLTRDSLDWLGTHLAGRAGPGRTAPVRVHVTGAGEWRELPAWPPETTPREWYPHPGATLAEEAPAVDAPPASFTFDPADPTPTMGGPMLDNGGYVDDSALAARTDVLSFTGPVLREAVEVLGAPEVELWHRSDNPHADLFVRLSEVDTGGRSHNITEGYRRLAPDRADGPVRLTLLPTAHRFRPGTRIRLLVAGGSHPHYARNLGTAENPGTGSTLVPARHTVAYGESRLVLPVPAGPVEPGDSPAR
jgi:putative CocE/NonD family hydrolase